MTYSIDELARAVRYKDHRPYLVRTALKLAGKEAFTLSESDSAIEDYLKGGVKNG